MPLTTGPIRLLTGALPNILNGTAKLKFSATIYLQIEDSPGLVAVQLLGPAALGRADENNDALDIDLTPYNAAGKGVSRRHAVLERDRNMVALIDQESKNGTYLNGQRLKPFERRLVRDGDEIRLANLSLRIFFRLAASDK